MRYNCKAHRDDFSEVVHILYILWTLNPRREWVDPALVIESRFGLNEINCPMIVEVAP